MKAHVICKLLPLCILFINACDQGVSSTNTNFIECRLNSDCSLGQSCVEGECVDEQNTVSVCIEVGCECSTDSDCLPPLVCNLEKSECDRGCSSSSDCRIGESCVSNACTLDVEADRDNDGIPDGTVDEPRDNCVDVVNAQQADNDEDSIGDACDDDDDNDGIVDGVDNCPYTFNPNQANANGDELGNVCDPVVSGINIVSGVLQT